MRSKAAFTQGIFFQTTELLVEQVARHLNQTYNYIDANGRVAVFDTLLEGFVGPAGRAVELPKAPGVGRLKCPFGNPVGAHKVPIMSCLRSLQKYTLTRVNLGQQFIRENAQAIDGGGFHA
jgi:hypothetical protein